MNNNKIYSLFTLFSGESDIDKYMPIISSAISEVESRIKPDSDLSDDRISFLCAAIANLRYMELMVLRDSSRRTIAGTVTNRQGGVSGQISLAASLAGSYMENAKDLLCDTKFSFISTKG